MFVAPVESDLPSKRAGKNTSSTSPARSAIRRASPPPSRYGNRRHARSGRESRLAASEAVVRDFVRGTNRESVLTEREDRILEEHGRDRLLGRQDRNRPLPWVESGFPPEPPGARPSLPSPPVPSREVLQETTRDEQRRQRVEAQINDLFGESLLAEDPSSVPRYFTPEPGNINSLWWSRFPPQNTRVSRELFAKPLPPFYVLTCSIGLACRTAHWSY